MFKERRQTVQTIAWFNDLYKRNLLDLEPPYQRRSVWNQAYKSYFIETILLQYPAPAIFLHEDISPDGLAKYSVVDGKQRLSSIFEFTENGFSVSEKCPVARLSGLYFEQFSEDDRKLFWTYQFAVEYLPTTDESTLNGIFDRINRNVAKLTPQELRHARYSGEFITVAEELAEYMSMRLTSDFPNIASASRRQMKDVELVTHLLLLTERGVESNSQADLDTAYSTRDEVWDERQRVEEEFREVISKLAELSNTDLLSGVGRRLKNQADFYSLFGAILDLSRSKALPPTGVIAQRLEDFLQTVSDEEARETDEDAKRYFGAARSASNDVGPRTSRIRIISKVILEG